MDREFLNKLRGKNTLELAHMLAQEFTDSFGEEWGTKEEIVGKLVPKGKAPSWTMLDRNMNVFCRQFYETREENEDKINFFDRIRFQLYELPMKLNYKTKEIEEISLTPEKFAENFTTCSLCWRSVLQKPRERKTALCHLHDIPSSYPEYRRRSRMKKQVEDIRLKLLKSLPALTKLKLEDGINLDEYVKSLCLSEQSPLTQLAKYLQSQMDEIDNKINASNLHPRAKIRREN